MERNFCELVARDRYLLEAILDGRPPLTDEWLALLNRKLSGGRMPAPGAALSDLAVIDARVSFRCASGLTDMRTLCLPAAYVPGGTFLPVTTFYGLALLGLRVGQSMAFDRPEGRRDWVVLENVLYQPDAAERARSVPEPEARPRLRMVAGGRAAQDAAAG